MDSGRQPSSSIQIITDPTGHLHTAQMGRCAHRTCGWDATAGALLRAVRSGDDQAVAGLIDIGHADLQVVDGVRAPP